MERLTEFTEITRDACEKHFKLKNFLLEYEKPHHFVQPQFGALRRYYLVWRAFWAMFHLAWLIGIRFFTINSEEENGIRWFVHFTNWSYRMLTLDLLLELFAVFYVQTRRQDIMSGSCSYMPSFLKVLWCMYNVSNGGALVVSLLCWTVTHEASFGNFVKHFLNSVYVIVNLAVTAVPVRIYHVFHLAIFGVIFVLSCLAYDFFFPIPLWRTLGTESEYSAAIVLVMIPFCHLFMFLVYLVRVALFDLCQQRIVAVMDADKTVVAMDTDETVANKTVIAMNTDKTKAAWHTDKTIAVKHDDKTVAIRDTDKTVAVKNSDKTVAVKDTDKIVAANDTDETVAASDSDETVAASDSDETVAASDTDETISANYTDETVAVKDTDKRVVANDTDETVAASDSDETAAVKHTDKTAAAKDSDKIVAVKDTDKTLAKYTDKTAAAKDTDKTAAAKDTDKTVDFTETESH
ncbi:uncharacterized protein LOC121392303 [Gigantopelta aegis]|uniref:uncharacterized protein LOC121392303 n=1 Tax=Gigantopelta aegis TaxID=1735272 RepID=UPI001B88838B|nr:uncharacterized protein LOC121392303 [Gigantopelta aegis]